MTPREIDVEELARRRKSGDSFVLLDVREPWEVAIVALSDSTFIPMRDFPRGLNALSADEEIAVMCHSGQRSIVVAEFLAEQGFTNVANVTGGIDEYARRVDPLLPRY